MFDELRKTPFCPRKGKQGHVVEVEDGSLLGFAAFKDLQVSAEDSALKILPLKLSPGSMWLWCRGEHRWLHSAFTPSLCS